MIGITRWNDSPYKPLCTPQIESELYVCRIAPFANGYAFDFVDREDKRHVVLYRPKATGDWITHPIHANHVRMEGLENLTDYEFCVRRTDSSGDSEIRLVRTGEIPGVIVNYLHPEDTVYSFSGRYLCSPSIVVLPDGTYLAAMDVHAGNQAQNLTILFRSIDKGKTWMYLTELYPCFWGKLFVHRNKLYMLGVSCEYGDLLLGYSLDNGESWFPPVRLFAGSNAREAGPHKAPMPVVEHQGRLYTAIEYGSWKYKFHNSAVLSIDAEADLMNPANWHLSEPLPFSSAWLGMPAGDMQGYLEGNAVVSPAGEIVNLLRLQQPKAFPSVGKAVMLRMNSQHPDSPLAFDSVIDFPLGANSKFVVLRDDAWYIAVGNEGCDADKPTARNVLSVAISKDLHTWKVVNRIVDEAQSEHMKIAFQYPDAAIDGDDLLILSRTAYNGAHSFHDSNLITFHRMNNFRQVYTHACCHNAEKSTRGNFT